MARITTPVDSLWKGSLKNYEVAIKYYSQKREAMQKFLKEEQRDIEKSLTDYITKKATEFQSQVVKKMYDAIEEAKNNPNPSSPVNRQLPDLEMSLDNIVQKFLSNPSGDKRQIASAAGTEFELFLHRALQPSELIKEMPGFVGSQFANLLGTLENGFQHSGKYTTSQGITNGAASYMKSDLLLNVGVALEAEKLKGGNTLYSANNQALELTSLIDLSMAPDYLYSNSKFLQAYARNNVYGFQAKVWEKSNGKNFAKSAFLQQKNNSDMKEPRTWETAYAPVYAIFTISRYLLNVVGINNVAMITGGGFQWMDDFLSNKIFFMTVQVKSSWVNKMVPSKRPNGAGGYEAFQEIKDDEIKIRNLGASRAITTARSKKTGKISVRNRRITSKKT